MDCCKEKKTERDLEEKEDLIIRLNRISGQINGLKKMVEEDKYCTDILIQASAVNAAIHSFNSELVASHIKHCVVNGVKNDDDEVIEELIGTLKKLMK